VPAPLYSPPALVGDALYLATANRLYRLRALPALAVFGETGQHPVAMRPAIALTLTLLAAAGLAATATAQQPAPATPPAAASAPSWEFNLSGAFYILPDEEDFLQPTFRADRGRLHLETRYNYEDRDSVSFFAGANFEFGEKVEFTLTPMLGGLVGQTDGIVPAFEASLSVWKLEAYAEAEYVFDLGDSSSNFFYMWSEVSLWPTEWLRAGLVTQRTRVYQTERDVQRGLLVGFSYKKLDGTVYFFNPGSDDHFTVVSLGVSF
jgi:hypothetical protein